MVMRLKPRVRVPKSYRVRGPNTRVMREETRFRRPRARVRRPKPRVMVRRARVRVPKNRVRRGETRVKRPKLGLGGPHLRLGGPKLGLGLWRGGSTHNTNYGYRGGGVKLQRPKFLTYPPPNFLPPPVVHTPPPPLRIAGTAPGYGTKQCSSRLAYHHTSIVLASLVISNDQYVSKTPMGILKTYWSLDMRPFYKKPRACGN
jgi:hypothetical protein